MQKHRLTIGFFLIVVFSTLWGQPKDSPEPPPETKQQQQPLPDLNNLEVGWWEYFDFSSPELETHIDKFISVLKGSSKTLSPENKQTAQSLIDKIRANLNTFVQNAQRPIPEVPPPSTLKERYTIDQVVSFNKELRKQKIDLKAQQSEMQDKEKQIENTEDLLRTTTRRYINAERRSELKIVTALEIIAIRTNLEILQQSHEILQKSIKVKKETIQQKEEELTAARTRMASSDLDLILFSKQVKENQEKLTEAEKSLKHLETEEAAALSKSLSAEPDDDYLLLAQETDQGEINLMLAQNQAIFSQIKLALARMLINPTRVDLYHLSNDIRRWEALLPIYKGKFGEWTTQAERQLQRTGQLLTTEGAASKQQPTDLSETQQRIISLAQSNLLLVQRLDKQIKDTEFLLVILNSKVSQELGGGRRWLQEVLEFFSTVYQQGSIWFDKELFYIGKNPVTFFDILQFFGIIIFTVWISKFILKYMTRIFSQRKGVHKSLVYRVSRLFYYFLLGIGLLIAISALGFDFSNLVLIAGALGVGLGFGLQSIFNNFISGIILLFESHLKVGDFIELESGLRGEIREINVRSTLITDNDGIDVLIPNSEIISNKVLNWTLKVPYRRVSVPFTVAYGTDKDFVAKIIVEAAKTVPHTLTKLGIPEPVVRLINLGADGMEFELIVWVTEKYTKRSRTTRSDYLWVIETAIRKNNITIPFPQRDVHIIPQENEKN